MDDQKAVAAIISAHQSVIIDLVRIIHGFAPEALDQLHADLQAAIASPRSERMSEGAMLALRHQYEVLDEGLRPPG